MSHIPASRPIHVVSILGTQLDDGRGHGRWQRWRPSVAIGMQPGVQIARFDLLHGIEHSVLAQRVAEDIRSVQPSAEVETHALDWSDPWSFEGVYSALFDWARAQRFDVEATDVWVHITTGTHVAQICLFLLTETRLLPGVLLQTAPTRPQRQDNLGTYSLINLDLSRYDAIAQRFEQDAKNAEQYLKSGIETRNAAFNALITEVERVALRSRAPVLLSGPTGAGKSYLARRIYDIKRERKAVSGAFVDVNCATLQGDGAASSLFGHKRGAFTGAAADRAGLLKSADKGVLFLDEIGTLGLDEQAMLLKAIEDKRFLPVGSDKEVESDFQLIAGTNLDLRQAVAAGRFREDLFARINLWTYTLPGLAERPEDIEPNIDYLLQKLSVELGQQARFNVEAKSRYLRFATSSEAKWSGNFRDLTASVTRLATLAEAGRISTNLVEAEIARLQWLWAAPTESKGDRFDLTRVLDAKAITSLDQFDRLQLESVLAECARHHTLSEAGRALFAVSRLEKAGVNDTDRLRKYLAKYGLRFEAGRVVTL